MSLRIIDFENTLFTTPLSQQKFYAKEIVSSETVNVINGECTIRGPWDEYSTNFEFRATSDFGYILFSQEKDTVITSTDTIIIQIGEETLAQMSSLIAGESIPCNRIIVDYNGDANMADATCTLSESGQITIGASEDFVLESVSGLKSDTIITYRLSPP